MPDLIDLTGKTFGRWTVIEKSPSTGEHAEWLCRCKCGNNASVQSINLRSGASTQCSACSGHRVIDLTGKLFGQWTVLEKAETVKTEKSWTVLWLCRCACGETARVGANNLRQGKSTKCATCARNKKIDLVGKTFGQWTVLEEVEPHIYKNGIDKRVTYLCRCTCGRTGKVMANNLKNSKSQRCIVCAKKTEAHCSRPFEALYNRAKDCAKRARHEFTISYEAFADIAKTTECHYCHSPLSFSMYATNTNGSAYQLDRKDNSKGYIPGNVVPCCKTCNRAKSSVYTYDEWYGMTSYLRSQKNQERQI